MTVNELKRLCKAIAKDGYKDSHIYMVGRGEYVAASIELSSNEWGDIVITVKPAQQGGKAPAAQGGYHD